MSVNILNQTSEISHLQPSVQLPPTLGLKSLLQSSQRRLEILSSPHVYLIVHCQSHGRQENGTIPTEPSLPTYSLHCATPVCLGQVHTSQRYPFSRATKIRRRPPPLAPALKGPWSSYFPASHHPKAQSQLCRRTLNLNFIRINHPLDVTTNPPHPQTSSHHAKNTSQATSTKN